MRVGNLRWYVPLDYPLCAARLKIKIHLLVALTAMMRKLLHAIYGMFKHRQPFDGAKLYRLPDAEISTEKAA